MGFYIDVTKVEYPEQALQGANITAKVTVKNKSNTIDQYVLVMGGYDSNNFYAYPEYALVGPGSSKTFSISLPMPNKDIVFGIWTYIWVEYSGQTGYWYNDDSRTVSIGLDFPDLKVLSYQILGESSGGRISFDPGALDGEGRYYKGTRVQLYAIPNSGYVFVKWRGEVDNPLSTDQVNYVTMSENRLVKAEFAKEATEPDPEVLEVDITPVGSGYVRTSYPSLEGRSTWNNGDTGTFNYGSQVKVTAFPNDGYRFEKWSDEIVGGTSTANPAMVQDMTEHRAVKAHFRLKDQAPPTDTTPPDDGDTTTPDDGSIIPPDLMDKIPWTAVGIGAAGIAAFLLLTGGKKK